MKRVLTACFAVISVLSLTLCYITPSYGMLYTVNHNSNTAWIQINSVTNSGQSFTATDTDIGYVGLWLSGGGTFTLSLYQGDGYSGTLLKSQQITTSASSPNWVDLDVSSINFSADTSYTIGILGSNTRTIQMNQSNVYSGGSVYWGGTNYSGMDVNFHVGPRAPTVPIPAAVWLLGSGLIGLIGVRRFRK